MEWINFQGYSAVRKEREWEKLTRAGNKALQKAASSVFHSFAKFETNSVPILPKLSKISHHNQIFIFKNNQSDSNFNQKFDYEFGTIILKNFFHF